MTHCKENNAIEHMMEAIIENGMKGPDTAIPILIGEDWKGRQGLFETGGELIKPHNGIYKKNVALSVPRADAPLYLKQLEFRCNCRHDNKSGKAADCLFGLVP
ncbi:MAG: hypothetical protein DRH32_02675 [Deltaproteobacteria bacterium]|nr:MAG: hypothetical protein DRH32_02675 [Deltaproteobacteria bacterium]